MAWCLGTWSAESGGAESPTETEYPQGLDWFGGRMMFGMGVLGTSATTEVSEVVLDTGEVGSAPTAAQRELMGHSPSDWRRYLAHAVGSVQGRRRAPVSWAVAPRS